MPSPIRTAAAVIGIVALSACQADGDAAPTSVNTIDQASTTPTTPVPTTPVTTSPATTIPATTTTSSSISTTTTSTTTTTTTTTSTTTTTTTPVGGRSGSIQEVRPPSDIPPPPLPDGWTTELVGRSAFDRDITALVRPGAPGGRIVVAIGGLHGNEPVTPPTVRGFVEAELPSDVTVWLVPEANPDGVAAGTRWNANGVDLNRNFSWDWRESDGGAGPLSEPETQALTALVDGLQPDLVVWVHQPYGYVSSIGPTDRAFEQAWSAGSGVPVRSGVTQHGGGESWTAFIAGRPSMLIEIDSWEATQEIVDAHRGGFESVVAALG